MTTATPDAALQALLDQAYARARHAAVVMGTPSGSMGLPQTTAFAATLLILREFMHHMQYAALEFLPA